MVVQPVLRPAGVSYIASWQLKLGFENEYISSVKRKTGK